MRVVLSFARPCYVIPDQPCILLSAMYLFESISATQEAHKQKKSGCRSKLDKQSCGYTGGTLIRGENDSRIDFLAKVRNKALEPLWKLANHSPGTEKKKAGLAVEPWKADRIVFMNDVFVCAKDFMRLLLHDVDMACGLDFGDRDKVSTPLTSGKFEGSMP